MNNLVVRTISGIIFIALLIFCVLWSQVTYLALFSIIILLMMYEYVTITTGKTSNFFEKVLAMGAGFMFFIITYFISAYDMEPKYLIITLLPFIIIYIYSLYIKQYNLNHPIIGSENKVIANGYNNFTYIITSFVYIALPLSSLNFILFKPQGLYYGNILLSMLIILWCTDVGAYCAGSTLGQKFGGKLFPSVSPKKSWIGFWGGLSASIIGAIILYYCNMLPFSITESVILSIIICIFAVFGDLVESQLKRNFGVKDSGSIMPGHGGMLDRFDGALLAFPMAVIYILLFVN